MPSKKHSSIVKSKRSSKSRTSRKPRKSSLKSVATQVTTYGLSAVVLVQTVVLPKEELHRVLEVKDQTPSIRSIEMYQRHDDLEHYPIQGQLPRLDVAAVTTSALSTSSSAFPGAWLTSESTRSNS